MATVTWRNLQRAALAAAFGLISGVAQAIIYPIIFDPPTGPGTVEVENDICVSDSEVRCILNLLTTHVVDSNGDEWMLTSPFFDVADPEGSIIVDTELRQLVAFDSRPVTLALVSDSIIVESAGSIAGLATPAQTDCDTATLRLFSDTTTSLVGCFVRDSGTYEIRPAIPEPVSLALVLAGAGAAWLARRRKVRA